jgi:hypothetical protein
MWANIKQARSFMSVQVMPCNLLIPKKMALYAIAENFDRLGRKDPDIETAEERRERLEQMAADEANVELIAANVLQKYLRNKVVSAN